MIRPRMTRPRMTSNPDSPVDPEEEQGPPSDLEALVDQLDQLWQTPEGHSPAAPFPTTLTHAMPAGTTLGRFQIEGLLGSGAFGVVYSAYDPRLDRRVALKLPRAEVLLDVEKRERFATEASLAAALDHPGIVPIYEAELDTPTPHLVSGLCLGPDLAKWLAKWQEPIPWEQAAHCMVQIAEAVEYAHRQGVFHRDLKPSNILLMPKDEDQGVDAELCEYQPRITDFGLSKLADASLAVTRSSMLIGTPLYMAPEQIDGSPASNMAATDIYSLGVILFELLAGRPPIEGDSYVEVLDKLRNQTPTSLRLLRKDIPVDLDTIAMCALAKVPEDRYQTAASLAEDLTRCVEGRPILAKPISLGKSALRWTQRNRGLSMTAVATLALLACFSMIAAVMVLRANTTAETALTDSRQSAEEAGRQAEVARRSKREAAKLLYGDDMIEAAKAWRENEPGQARLLLDRYRPIESTTADELEADPRGFEWTYLDRMTSPPAKTLFQTDGEDAALYVVEMAPDGEHFLSAGQESIVRWHRLDTGEVVHSFDTEQIEVNRIAFSPSGKLYVTAGDDGSVKVWQTVDHALVCQTSKKKGKCLFAVFLDEDQVLFGGDIDAIYIYSIQSEKMLRKLSPEWLIKRRNTVYDAVVSSDHSRVWLGKHGHDIAQNPGVYEWDLASGKLQEISAMLTVGRLLYDAQHQRLIAKSTLGEVQILSAETGEKQWEIELSSRPESIALSSDGRWLAAGDRDGQIKMWDLLSGSNKKKNLGRPDRIWNVHDQWVYHLQFTPGDQGLLSVGRDGAVRRLPLEESVKKEFVELTSLENLYGQPLSNSPYFLCSNPLSLLELSTGKVVAELSPETYSAVCYDPERQLVAAASQTTVGVWQVPSGAALESHEVTWPGIHNIDWLPGKHRLMVNEFGLTGKSPSTFNFDHTGIVHTIVRAGGRWALPCIDDGVVARGRSYQIRCWNISDGTLRWKTPRFRGRQASYTVSPDGRWLAIGDTRLLTLYDCKTGDIRYAIPSDFWIKAICFDPTGSTLVLGGSNGEISFLQSHSGQKLFDLAPVPSEVQSLCFSGDRLLVSAGVEGELRWYQY